MSIARWMILSVGWLVATGGLPAQYGEVADRPDKIAGRLVRFLELPQRSRDAARGLLAMGSPAVPALVRSLNDPRPEIVFRCLQILRRLGPDAASALPALARLGAGDDLALSTAARWAMMGMKPVGRALLVDIAKHRLVIIDGEGKILRDTVHAGLYDAERLPGGEFLLGRLRAGRLQKIDAKGKVLWEFKDCKSPIDVDWLPGGNVLVGGGSGKRAFEVDPKGKIVWEYKSAWPNDCDRLPCGNTLISDYQVRKVVEVDPKGKIVWEVKTPAGVIDAERLNSGNTLMVLNDTKMVVEVDPKGGVVREFKTDKQPKCADRLANGNTLIGCEGSVVEFDRAGKMVWEVKLAGEWSTVQRF